MKYAIMENQVVVNVIETTPEFAEKIGAICIEETNVNIGDVLVWPYFTRTTESETIVIYEIPKKKEITKEGLQSEIDSLKSQLDITEDALNFLIMNGGVLDA